ncbi:MAG TPA: type III pantothenate kinase [Gemmataceae bacterium]|jgi:type III pantothenate kinase|nr:type III pantothenate kinase [Gemmataceae bacterium]
MPDAVVDIGNSRVKFCRVTNGRLELPVRGLPADDLAAWERLASEWGTAIRTWAVASTVPERLRQFIAWAESRGEKVIAIDAARKIPIGVSVDEPNRVGLDRLLNVLAVKAAGRPGEPAIIVDAGSAVTIDLLHERGSFAGGVIFPGLRLMALSLKEHTAALPLVDAASALPPGPPGTNTEAAIKLGLLYAIAGGADAVVREMASRCTIAPRICLTGGDMSPQLAGLMQSRHQFRSEIRPALTLEGILHAAEYLS